MRTASTLEFSFLPLATHGRRLRRQADAGVRPVPLQRRAHERTILENAVERLERLEVIVEDLRYPIGRFVDPGIVTEAQRDEWIEQLAVAPANLRRAVEGLNTEQLDTPYRDGGWTVRQVVHHLPDSHMNSYVRMRLALTEAEPTIKPYAENLWAELPDARSAPPELSLALLGAMHARWVLLLRRLQREDWQRTFRHPERGVVRLDTNLGIYWWHGRHHVAQIAALRARRGW